MKYPKTRNLKLYKNSEFTSTISLENPNHTPKNLTGYIAISQMKREYDSTFGIQIQCIIQNPLSGVIKLYLPSAITAQFENEYSNNNNLYVYDVVIKNISNNMIEQVQNGSIYITPGVLDLYDPNTAITVDPTPENTFINDFLDGGFF
jgi:hypothetical protein